MPLSPREVEGKPTSGRERKGNGGYFSVAPRRALDNHIDATSSSPSFFFSGLSA